MSKGRRVPPNDHPAYTTEATYIDQAAGELGAYAAAMVRAHGPGLIVIDTRPAPGQPAGTAQRGWLTLRDIAAMVANVPAGDPVVRALRAELASLTQLDYARAFAALVIRADGTAGIHVRFAADMPAPGATTIAAPLTVPALRRAIALMHAAGENAALIAALEQLADGLAAALDAVGVGDPRPPAA